MTTSPVRVAFSKAKLEDVVDESEAWLSGKEIRCDCELIHPPARLAESMSVIFVEGNRVDKRYAVVRPVKPAPRTVTCDGGAIGV